MNLTRRHPEEPAFRPTGRGSPVANSGVAGDSSLRLKKASLRACPELVEGMMPSEPLLAESNRQLPLWRRHLTPDLLHILLQSQIVGTDVERFRIPAIGGWQIARHAGPSSVEHTQRDHRFGIGGLRQRTHRTQSVVTILRHSIAVD